MLKLYQNIKRNVMLMLFAAYSINTAAAANTKIPGASVLRAIVEGFGGYFFLAFALAIIGGVLAGILILVFSRDLKKAGITAVGAFLAVIIGMIFLEDIFDITNIFLNAGDYEI
ncbi:MAG: hypothetical protein KAI72_04340 [Candidatus Pacebacteria bacterium]|nr:hypothetical protein [Candidatus Paceibacterota bacterium]